MPKDSTFIEKPASLAPALDFDFLRKESLRSISRLSGDLWTDHNLHDPGITIIEQICYAITELAYRTHFPLADILADKNNSIPLHDNAFYPKEEILTVAPHTFGDYRRLIIQEIVNIRNIFMEEVKPGIKGLYRVVVQPVDSNSHEQLTVAVKRFFAANRGLCEDLEEVVVMSRQEIFIRGEIIAEKTLTPERLLAEIYNVTETYLAGAASPDPIENREKPVEELFEGPRLEKRYGQGIFERPLKEIDLAGLSSLITEKVSKVLKVRNLAVSDDGNKWESSIFLLETGRYPELKITLHPEKSMKIYHENFQVPINHRTFESVYIRKKSSDAPATTPIPSAVPASDLVQGRFRNIENYFSIQHHFPMIYGIGEEGLPGSVDKRRKAQALQLKGYLLFFEQILANYLSQLGNLRHLFAVPSRDDKARSYYMQGLHNIPGPADLFNTMGSIAGGKAEKDAVEAYMEALKQGAETRDDYLARKNRVADHLLARFNEVVQGLPALLSTNLYHAGALSERLLKIKSGLLTNYPAISYGRAKGAGFSREKFERAPLERKLLTLLDIGDHERKRLSAPFGTGFARLEQSYSYYGHSEWGEKEMIPDSMLFSAEDIARLQAAGQLTDHTEDRQEEAVFFPSLTAGKLNQLIRSAIHASNYRLAEAAGSGETLLLFNIPEESEWRVLSRHSGREEALNALDRFVNGFMKINREAEGFHLVEHILLRPPADEKLPGFPRDDFFSFRATVILPDWPARFQDEEFRKFLENLFIEEFPTHIRLSFKWLGPAKMEAFETVYFNWLDTQEQSAAVFSLHRRALIDLLY